MQRLQLRDIALLSLLAVLLWLQHALPFVAGVLNCFLFVCSLAQAKADSPSSAVAGKSDG